VAELSGTVQSPTAVTIRAFSSVAVAAVAGNTTLQVVDASGFAATGSIDIGTGN
jgi:hypothetical protein